MGYYDNVNEDLLAMVPPDAAKICEIGCGTGDFAKAYKQINPDCEYHGIELDFSAYRRAEDSRVFKDVRNADVEKIWGYTLDHFEPDLDVLICGDLIEHLKDPWGFMGRTVKDWLRPGGQFIACVPNSQNFTLVANLLAGHFEYQDAGLLDRTHLRFFTRYSLVNMFEKVGLSVVSVEPRNWGANHDDSHKMFMKTMESFLSLNKIDRKEFANDTRAFQWLIKGVKGDPPARKIVIRGISANACCARPRLDEPGKFLATIPGVRYSNTAVEVKGDESPVIIVQRDKYDSEQVRKWVQSGVLVIGEWDDCPGYFEGNQQSDYLPIRGVHAVSVSTEVMAETVSNWNPNVGVFHNQIDRLPPPREERNGPIRIFCAWQNRTEDWKEIINPLNDMLQDYPETEVTVIFDREFYHSLKTQNKKYWSFQTYERYIQLLRQCDIALLPMADSEFSRHKSDIKLLECAANGVFAIYPEESVYFAPSYGIRSGMSYRTIADFRHNLSFAINCIRDRKDLQTCGLEGVKKYRLLKDHYRDRYRWINALLDTREELTEQLAERCPELGI